MSRIGPIFLLATYRLFRSGVSTFFVSACRVSRFVPSRRLIAASPYKRLALPSFCKKIKTSPSTQSSPQSYARTIAVLFILPCLQCILFPFFSWSLNLSSGDAFAIHISGSISVISIAVRLRIRAVTFRRRAAINARLVNV